MFLGRGCLLCWGPAYSLYPCTCSHVGGGLRCPCCAPNLEAEAALIPITKHGPPHLSQPDLKAQKLHLLGPKEEGTPLGSPNLAERIRVRALDSWEGCVPIPSLPRVLAPRPSYSHVLPVLAHLAGTCGVQAGSQPWGVHPVPRWTEQPSASELKGRATCWPAQVCAPPRGSKGACVYGTEAAPVRLCLSGVNIKRDVAELTLQKREPITCKACRLPALRGLGGGWSSPFCLLLASPSFLEFGSTARLKVYVLRAKKQGAGLQ